jgi:hypothetical protein
MKFKPFRILKNYLTIFYFDIELQQWKLTRKTCGEENGTEIFNSDGTITVLVRF